MKVSFITSLDAFLANTPAYLSIAPRMKMKKFKLSDKHASLFLCDINEYEKGLIKLTRKLPPLSQTTYLICPANHC
jgi:hypothetical protein